MSEGPWTLLVGDCRVLLAAQPAASVQCVVTSPPYWGLRDYGTAQWDGGDADCDHMGSKSSRRAAAMASSGLEGAKDTIHLSHQFKGDCGRCGARRIDTQIGLEPSPDAYVAQLVAVFREVRRVLRDDGTLWLNLGDSYAGSGKGGNPDEGKQATNRGSQPIGVLCGKTGETAREAALTNVSRRWTAENGIRAKQLIGVPWRAAFALQQDGWYLRSDVIWSKPNPMPESVTDRPTKSHEYIFLLTKQARYFYNADAIAEPASDAMLQQIEQGYDGLGLKDYDAAGVQNPSTVKARIIANARKRADRFGGNKHNGESTKHSDGSIYTGNVTRNKRSVWTVATQPFPGAHFAVMPEALVEPCILAGSKPGDTVLDPFAGSGTVGVVALRHGRRFVGMDLNPAYCEMARRRLAGENPLFQSLIAETCGPGMDI